MQGVVFLGSRQLEMQTFPDPVPGPNEVVLEIKALIYKLVVKLVLLMLLVKPNTL